MSSDQNILNNLWLFENDIAFALFTLTSISGVRVIDGLKAGKLKVLNISCLFM